MDIALIVTSSGSGSGNGVSARRVLQEIVAAGHRSRILDLNTLGPYVPNVLAAYEPDVVHAFHARKTGYLVREARPLVISLTGTDVGRDLAVPDHRHEVLEACRAAHALVVHSRLTAASLLEAEPALESKVRVVPKGMGLLEEAPFEMRAAFSVPKERPIFLMAGGLRPVKDQLRAIRALAGLDVELVIAGTRLDEEYAKLVTEEARNHPWVRLIDIRPQARMAGAYRDADVVLNTSATEGMSNALVEAMHFGRPILASDIPGNRALVTPGVTGLLFRTDEELRDAAKKLASDPALRATLGAAGAARAKAEHSMEAEMRALMKVYDEVVAIAPAKKGPPLDLP